MTAPDLDALEKRLREAADDFADHATPIEGDGPTATLLREAADMIAELKEARTMAHTINRVLSPQADRTFDLLISQSQWAVDTCRAFLARNGKGEG